MFERFTREARAAVTRARTYANALDHDRIGSQHLLLAALDDVAVARLVTTWGVDAASVRAAVLSGPGDLDAQALATVGVDFEAVSSRVKKAFGPGALRPRPTRRRRGDGFSPGAKASLELALHEALELEDHFIGVEHVLLGVLAERTGLGARILADHGVDLPALRDAVLDARGR